MRLLLLPRLSSLSSSSSSSSRLLVARERRRRQLSPLSSSWILAAATTTTITTPVMSSLSLSPSSSVFALPFSRMYSRKTTTMAAFRSLQTARNNNNNNNNNNKSLWMRRMASNNHIINNKNNNIQSHCLYSTTNNSHQDDHNGNDNNSSSFSSSSRLFPLDILSSYENDNNDKFTIDWDDRIGLQSPNCWTLEEKGWNVKVEWKETPYGAGLFAAQDIPRDTILRRGVLGYNLKQFTSLQDIEDFCQKDGKPCLMYVKDYLWGFTYYSDNDNNDHDNNDPSSSRQRRRFFGMWVPGNGLNHNPNPNTVYVKTADGIDLVALTDILAGDEMVDDYKRHGSANDEPWLLEFADKYQVSLNFADCNDFVNSDVNNNDGDSDGDNGGVNKDNGDNNDDSGEKEAEKGNK